LRPDKATEQDPVLEKKTKKPNDNTKNPTLNLAKYIQNLYKESYKTLLKDIKVELNKWRYSLSMHIKTQ
jgi:hypothetical protein